MAARATGEQHRRGRWTRRVCVVAFDYLFFDKTGNVVTRAALKPDGLTALEDIDLTIIVAKDLLGKAIFAHVVPQKGVDPYHFAVDVLLEDIKWLGYQKLVLRTDNEQAI